MQTQKDTEKSGKLVMSEWSLGILTPFRLCRGLFRNRCNRTVRRLESLSCGFGSTTIRVVGYESRSSCRSSGSLPVTVLARIMHEG